MKKQQIDLEPVYQACSGFAQSLLRDMGVDELEVAAVYASIALSIYRTTLNPDEYEAIVDAISDSRHNVNLLPTVDQAIH